MKSFTREEVAKHSSPNDCWIIIDAKVYDVTKFAAMHPGGEQLLLEYGGKDVTDDFYGLHRQEVLMKYAPRLEIGQIEGETSIIDIPEPDAISTVPYAEPSYWMGFQSPYFDESHTAFRKALRRIYAKIKPEALVNDQLGKPPSDAVCRKLGEEGILVSLLGPGPWLEGHKLPGGIAPKDYTYFHEMIAHEEKTRLGIAGIEADLIVGFSVGVPPIFLFGSPELKARVLPSLLKGEKRIALAITEPFAGSDVARIRATARRTPDGKYFIVNGVKKWITGGISADYFSVAVRTEKGISILLIERGPGLETKYIPTSSSGTGTAYITFENVKVPANQLLGEEGKGFQVIMYNFNHERWIICASVISGTRHIITECFKWAHQRKVFGKRLIDQPVIRNKLANMISQVEPIQNWLENITYQMCNMPYHEQSVKLAGPLALLKLRCTRVSHSVSDDACQIFGGRALTKTGMGKAIEEFQRTYKISAIPGGSEEIMADLGIRQAMKYFPANARL